MGIQALSLCNRWVLAAEAASPGWLVCAVLVLLGGCGSPEARQRVSVAAAADLQFALAEIVEAFSGQHPEIDVQLTYGSSGNFFAQLTNRAPFDLYLSADIEYPRRLVAEGHAASEFRYAEGLIVIWVRNDSPLNVEALQERVLLEPSVRRIAIANPQHAPYGHAAMAALDTWGLREQVADRLVIGESIAQAAQFVESGAADVGIIALSLATAPAMRDEGRYWQVPLDAHPPIKQGGVVLRWAQSPAAAEALAEFLTSDAGRAILERYGFILRGSD